MNNQLHQIEVVIIAFVDNQKQVMLNRRADANTEMWEFIGGGVEKNESPFDAIFREIREEIGYQLDQKTDKVELVKQFDYLTDKFAAKVHCFRAIFPGMDRFSDSNETFVKDLALYEINDVMNLNLLPMTRIFIEDLINGHL